MTPQLLLQHFDRISDAPDAIPRLRRFILDLAVRGKLVEQDPRDEPASKLLKRIQAETARLVSTGEIKKEKSLPVIEKDEIPFELPIGWAWERIGNIGDTNIGLTYSPQDISDVGIPVLRSSNIQNGKLVFSDLVRVKCEPKQTVMVQDGDLLICARNGSRGLVGKVAVIEDLKEPAAFGAFMAILRSGVNQYLYHFICSPLFRQVIDEVNTTTINQITQNNLRSTLAPIPPLAEQHRIVAKVDELMAFCDRLEASQAERESRRDRLVASSLHRLNNGENIGAFRDHARFYFNHLPRLSTKGEDIQQLRQTILNLAVRWKLALQDPNEEPATELLRRIQAEKARLRKEGKITLSVPFLETPEDAMPFRLPTNWHWVRFGELIIDADAGWSPKSEGFPRSADNWGVLKVSAVSWDKFLPEENKQLLPGVIPPKSAQVRSGDFLISRANTSELVAKCIVVGDAPRNLILSDKIVRLHIYQNCDKRFLCIVNNHAEHARSYYAEEASGTSLSMKNVSRAVIYALMIQLPPLAEQHRIVAKVDELMALCDRLEAQLTTTHSDSRRLLEAVLHEALAPAV